VGFRFDGFIVPQRLRITNRDKPGLVGRLGTLLGDAGINFATFHLGRLSAGSDAICLIEIDEPVSEPVLTQIRGLKDVVQVESLSF
jgi:D-3-phosphoglycerate dehydrogenase / 2-oxoglutarate reductase